MAPAKKGKVKGSRLRPTLTLLPSRLSPQIPLPKPTTISRPPQSPSPSTPSLAPKSPPSPISVMRRWGVQIDAPAKDGEANAALLDYISMECGLNLM